MIYILSFFLSLTSFAGEAQCVLDSGDSIDRFVEISSEGDRVTSLVFAPSEKALPQERSYYDLCQKKEGHFVCFDLANESAVKVSLRGDTLIVFGTYEEDRKYRCSRMNSIPMKL